MTITRVATTITNVREGTMGALARYNIAAMEAGSAIAKMTEQASKAGTMTYNEAYEVRQHLYAIDKLVEAGWYRAIDADHVEAQRIQAETERVLWPPA